MSTVLVAGHICLDIIPAFPPGSGAAGMLSPGGLTAVGPAAMATGGAVANTGLALHKLGIDTRLGGKIGNDLFGNAILDRLRAVGPELAEGMIVDCGATSSYTVVISPPGADRMFLHCPGANDTFVAADVSDGMLAEADLLHFGYPPLMRRFYENEGEELERLFSRAKTAGLTTSLDMARPDPNSPAGRVDWTALLKRCLPQVDIFTPSLDELLYMLDREKFDTLEAGSVSSAVRADWADEAARACLELGAAVVFVKCGGDGCRLQTTDDASRLQCAGPILAGNDAWRNVSHAASCCPVHVAGTTGAGDTTIAGFLAGLMRRLGPLEAMDVAVATGACCVEQPDATSGIPAWDALCTRMREQWGKRILTEA